MYRRTVLIMLSIAASVGIASAVFFGLTAINDRPRAPFDLPQGTASLSAEDIDICDAVLQYQIFNSAAGGRGKSTAFVEIQEANPPEEFLERFRNHVPPVETARNYPRGASVYYRIGAITRMGKDSASVEGGYYEGDMSSSGNVYHLIRENGTWIVVQDELRCIS